MARKKKGASKSGSRKRKRTISFRRLGGTNVYKRNPPILKAITGGLKDAALVKAGGIAGEMISGAIGMTGPAGTAVKAAVAGAMVFAPVSGDMKRMLIAGAMQPVLDDLLAMAGLDKVLGGAGVSAYLPGSDGVSAYLSGATEDDAYASGDIGAYVQY